MIGFFHENERYGCFSNWYPASFEYAGKHFVNSEQFMMFHKVLMFGQYDLAYQIMSTEDPAECKKIGRQKFPEFNSNQWELLCYTIVKRGVKAKFVQNEELLEILLGTGSELLAECSPYDKKWGIGIDINDPDRYDISKWKGKNLLGKVLMEIRDELQQEKMSSPDGKLHYIDACDLEPIKEWEMTAGMLWRIPQFYWAVHAYSETLDSYRKMGFFYHKKSLCAWETDMREKRSGGLPDIGFYEMKQDVYDTARRMTDGDRS